MTGAADPSSIRFGVFRFDERSGELWREGGEGRDPIRLPPQPSKLLGYLIRRRPQVVSAEDIRQVLWPDVEVEFEQGLRTCVRQIRSALGESASEARYIETIPRRGYRFLGVVEDTPSERQPVAKAGGRLAAVLLACGVGLALLIGASIRFNPAPAPGPVRIAVMPFEGSVSGGALPPDNGLAESVVEALVERLSSSAEIVGPTSTHLYSGRPTGHRELIEEFDIDLMVNARATRGASGPRVLVEIIRASDGAHLWAKYLDEFPQGRGFAETIADAVLESVN